MSKKTNKRLTIELSQETYEVFCQTLAFEAELSVRDVIRMAVSQPAIYLAMVKQHTKALDEARANYERQLLPAYVPPAPPPEPVDDRPRDAEGYVIPEPFDLSSTPEAQERAALPRPAGLTDDDYKLWVETGYMEPPM